MTAPAYSAGPDHTGINGETLTTHKTGINTTLQNLFEYKAYKLNFAETAMTVLGKDRVIWHFDFDAQMKEPAIGQIDKPINFAQQVVLWNQFIKV